MERFTPGPFSLDVPAGWTLSTVILTGPKEAETSTNIPWPKQPRPFQSNLIITSETLEAGQTLQAYLNRQLKGLIEAGVTRYEGAEPEIVRLASGLDGLVTEQIIVGPTGDRVRQMQLLCVKGGCAYTLITSDLDGPSFDASRDQFRALLLSFE
jgi:hypothetical protein